MGSWLRDIRFALRALRRGRAYALFSILALALCIGANATIFSLVSASLVRPLPYADPDALVWVWATRTDRDKAFFSIPNFIDTSDRAQTLAGAAALSNWGANLTAAGDPERLVGIRVTTNLFSMLGVGAAAGRTLLPGDASGGDQRVVVLGYGLWQRRFGGDPGVVGSTIVLNGDAHIVVGVLPRDFVLPGVEPDVAIPLDPSSDPRRTERGTNFLRMIARLKPGVTRAQAGAELASITSELVREYPDANAKLTAPRPVPLHEEISGSFQGPLLALLGAVAVVLLIACTNIASLGLARASARRGELTVRAALGASRARLLWLLVSESAIVALVGGALGLALASWGIRFLVALSPADLPRSSEVGIDGRVLAFTAVVAALAALVSGVLPALRASRIDLGEELRAGTGRLAGASSGGRARQALVVSEVALALVLLVAAGLLTRSLLLLGEVNTGFDATGLLVMRLSLPPNGYSNRDAVSGFCDNAAARIAEIPGVQSVAAVSVVPLSNINVRTDFAIVGRPQLSASDQPAAQNRYVSAGYFRAIGIPVARGREFDDHDTSRGQGVVVIDEELARRFFPDADPLGAHLLLDDGGSSRRDVEIVGLAGNVKHNGLDEEPTATLYTPIAQVPDGAVGFLANSLNLVVRTSQNPLSVADAVRREVRAVDETVPTSNVRSMEQLLATSIAPRRFSLQLFGVFACAAVLLAASGVFGVVSYAVGQRTREIGIRIALGAQPRAVVGLFLRQGFSLVLTGLLIGLVAALAVSRVLASQLYGVGAIDPVTFAIAPALLAGAGVLAIYLPARRAARVDPLIALRSE